MAATRKVGFLRMMVVLCSLLFCLRSPDPALAASADKKPNTLHLVHKIFIEPVSQIEKVRTIEVCLKEELEKQEFQVVDNPAVAEGTLSGMIVAEITLDGDENDTDKAIYRFELKVAGGASVWKAQIKFRSKVSFAENNEYAALKLVEKLSNEWRTSAKRAWSR